MATLKSLIREHNIRAEVEYGNHYNEDFPQSTPWDVTLKFGRRQMTVPFYTGPAWEREPDADDVLECLLSDADVENYSSMEEWAESLGYDPDSRKAEKIYNQCVSQTKKLHKFLDDAFETFMYADR